jgi:hypothetical protein
MTRRIVVLVVLAVVIGAVVYFGLTSYDAKRAGANGEVYSNGSSLASSKTTDSKATHPNAPAEESPAKSDSSQPVVYPPAATQSGEVPATADNSRAAGVPSGSDTFGPTPPDGLAFAGKGRYMLYRQGDITWRLDTDTGRSCALFATDEEWKKAKVYRAGCGTR